MRIAEATAHLANLLRNHYVKQDSKDPAILFLAQVARIKDFREQGNLDAWESAVLGVFGDSEWTEFECRPDYPTLEYAWEVGRFNMYGDIDEDKTRRFYRLASDKVFAITGQHPLSPESIDFSAW